VKVTAKRLATPLGLAMSAYQMLATASAMLPDGPGMLSLSSAMVTAALTDAMRVVGVGVSTVQHVAGPERLASSISCRGLSARSVGCLPAREAERESALLLEQTASASGLQTLVQAVPEYCSALEVEGRQVPLAVAFAAGMQAAASPAQGDRLDTLQASCRGRRPAGTGHAVEVQIADPAQCAIRNSAENPDQGILLPFTSNDPGPPVGGMAAGISGGGPPLRHPPECICAMCMRELVQHLDGGQTGPQRAPALRRSARTVAMSTMKEVPRSAGGCVGGRVRTGRAKQVSAGRGSGQATGFTETATYSAQGDGHRDLCQVAQSCRRNSSETDGKWALVRAVQVQRNAVVT
jgi:hypothetical protein